MILAQKQVLEVSSETVPITIDEISDAQSVDDSLQPITQALKDLVKPHHSGIPEFPEDPRILHVLLWIMR